MPPKSPSPKTLLEALKARFGGPSELDEPRPLEQIVLLILASSADMRKARAAMKRLQAEYVDWNEVRVTSAYELSHWLSPLGAKKSQEKAEQVKELLSTVYNRFNKLNLDFLGKEAKAAEEARKRERFQTYLQDKSLALHVMMTLHGTERQDIVVTPALSRAMQRLGLLNGKTSTVTATRSKLRDLYGEDEMIAVQWAFYQLVEAHCHPRSPECPDCPALKLCGFGAKEVKKRKAEEAKAAKIAAAKAAAEKKREAARARAEAKRAAAEKKKQAAAAAAAKKKAAAEKKKAAAAAKKKAAAKKGAARKSTKKTARKPATKKAARKSTKNKVAKKPATKKAAKKSTKKKVAKKPAAKKSTKKKVAKKKPGRKGRTTRRR